MAESLTLRIITPDSIVLDTPASSVRVPALDGSMGVLPGHAPMVAALGAGDLIYAHGGKSEHMFVEGGFAEVRDNTVRVVSQSSEPPSEIDVARAERAAERARTRLRTRHVEEGSVECDLMRAEAALGRALMRISVAHKALG
jgi:F-type H+-transporting ATPase subunit epsilon